MLCVLLLQAYADAFGGILAGTVLVSEGVHCVQSIDSDAEVDVTVTIQELRHGPRKPCVVIGFWIVTARGDVGAVGHMEMSWANTSERAVGEGV